LPEVVADAGLPFDPENRAQMVDAMIRIAEDDALRDALSRRGRERAGLFSWERTARAVLASAAAVHADRGRESRR
jgi:glycosyltransferase involved in cell wall biosynthesis